MKTPRLYLFDPNLKSAGGHYLGYARRVADAAEAVGIRTVLVANQEMKAETGNTRVLPILELDYWHEMCPAAGEDPHDHLARSADGFACSLSRVQAEEDLGDSDILFFPYVNLAEVMGLARWKRLAGIAPRMSLLFRRDLDEQGLDAMIGARAGASVLRQSLSDLCVSPGSERVRLFTDSDNLTEEHGQILRRRFQTAPIPVDTALFGAKPRRSGAAANIVYLGDARTEKGYAALPMIARALRGEITAGRVRMTIQSNFNIPGGEPGIAAARDFLSTLPNVLLLRNPISEAQYNEYLLQADVIVLPYQANRYVSRTSGILAEAICAGVPAVVPPGTWLAEQVRRNGAGVIYDSLDPEGPSRAVAEALAGIESLRSRAEDRRAAYAQFHRPARLVEFVCGAEAIRCHA